MRDEQLVKVSTQLCFILLFAFTHNQISAQPSQAGSVVTTHYTMDDGLPQSSVNDVTQTADGYIWLATFGGLVRFDGNTFTTFNRANTPGIFTDRILKLFSDSKGGIWMFPESTESRMMRFHNGVSKIYQLPVAQSGVMNIYEEANGNILLRVDDTLMRLQAGDFHIIDLPDSVNRNREPDHGEDRIWIPTNSKLYKIQNGKIALHFDLSGKILTGINTTTPKPSDPSILYVGTGREGILALDTSTGEIISRYRIGDIILDMQSYSTDRLFVQTPGDIKTATSEEFELFYPATIPEGLWLKTAFQDKDGGLWVGTGGDGLFHLRKSHINMIDTDNGMKTGKMLSITRLEDGTALLSTNCAGIFDWKNGVATQSTLHDFLPLGCYWSVFQDSRERIWVGGDIPYMTDSINKPGRFFDEEDGFNGYMIHAFFEDSKGTIWISTIRGLVAYRNDRFTRFTTDDGLYFNDTRALYEDSDGLLWIGTNAGLNTYDGTIIKKVPLLDQESDNRNDQPLVRAIHETSDGSMWIGTYGEGLFRIKEGVVAHITTDQGLFDNVISHIVEDENGYFWMGSNRGISRVLKNDLDQVADGRIPELISYSFGARDGMNSAETNGGFQPNHFRDEEGKIYLPTMDGVAMITVNDSTGFEQPSDVIIERIQSSDSLWSAGDEVVLPHDDAFLEIGYTSIYFSDPGKVQFRYKMQGLSDNWIEIGSQRKAVFTKLPPGTYTFMVSSGLNDATYDDQPAKVSIRVVPPFWQKGWFRALVVLLIVLVISGVITIRIRTLEHRNERQRQFSEKLLQQQESERKRIASELHDSIGQQILVIRNRAELAIRFLDKPNELNTQLQEIIESSIVSISDIRTISHDLRPVHLEQFGLTNALNSMCEDLRNSSPIELSYHFTELDQLIEPDHQILVYRIVQEAFHNIDKHAEATEASVTASHEDDLLIIRIWDNGKGFDIQSSEKAAGLGLLGIKERVETLGGQLTIRSSGDMGTSIIITINTAHDAKAT